MKISRTIYSLCFALLAIVMLYSSAKAQPTSLTKEEEKTISEYIKKSKSRKTKTKKTSHKNKTIKQLI
jgi:mannose/cellobiose epimerase-like protein (N-acyl-D-glucosamine 2-epimerase family)